MKLKSGRGSRIVNIATVLLPLLTCGALGQQEVPDTASPGSSLEFLPILTYDTDVGFGYGVKAFALDHLDLDESFDLVLFNSTKGEQWYRLVFSLPDFERRQGTSYPLALDVSFDYDKWIRSSYFGVGSRSQFDDREYYTKEPMELNVALSRAFAPRLIGQWNMRYRIVNDFNFEQGRALDSLHPSVNPQTVRYASLGLVLRYDSRNSFINPSRGLVLQGEGEFATGTVRFTRLGASVQQYTTLLNPGTVLAVRLGIQGLLGENLPLQVLLPAGGGGTLRGYPQDRFLDQGVVIGNAELRFPLVWRFGGIVGVDAGRVWNTLSELSLRDWASNGVAGLRLSMDTFIVRLDVGFGNETTGLYLNFGQMF